MDHDIDRIEDKQRKAESQRKTDNAYDIESAGVSVSRMSGQFICALKVYLLLSYKEEINKQQCCQRRINTRADRKEASEIFSDLTPYAEHRDIKAEHKNEDFVGRFLECRLEHNAVDIRSYSLCSDVRESNEKER